MIEISHVTKIYDKRLVVNDVSFSVENGSFVSIVGKSGSGKTTLMNMIGSLLLPDMGTITVDGKDISSFSEKEIARYRNETIGFIFQDFHLEPAYSVYENVTLPVEISGNRKGMKQRAKDVLKMVGMSDYIKSKVTELSGGEQQRICIARAMIQQPRIILADEPCGNLDTYNSQIVMELLRGLAAKGCTVLLITHNPDAAQMTDRIITLSDGVIIGEEVTGNV